MKNVRNEGAVAEADGDRQANAMQEGKLLPEADAKSVALTAELERLKSDLEKTRDDLDTARMNSQPTAPIYMEKQNLEERIRLKEMEIERHCRPQGRPGLPDVKTNQVIIGTSSVRRKNDASLETMGRKPDQLP